MDILEILSNYGVVAYALTIFFGGRFGLKYFSYFKQTKYNFLVFATVFATLFMAVEYSAGTWRVIDLGRYIITYAVVTTCYDFLAEKFPFLKFKNKVKNGD